MIDRGERPLQRTVYPVFPAEAAHPVSLEGLRSYTARVETPFFEKLQHVAALISMDGGWSTVGADRVFTGRGLCGLASLVFKEELDRQFGGAGVSAKVDVLSVNAGLDGDGEDDDHFHVRVQRTARGGVLLPSSDPLFIDPTYGQIKPEYAGKVLVATAAEMQQLYPYLDFTTPNAQWSSVLDDVERGTLLSFLKRTFGLTPERYQDLLNSLR